MQKKRSAKVVLLGLVAMASLMGTAWTAHAVNPDSGFYQYFTSQFRNASKPGKRVNYFANVNTLGCGIDTTSVSPSFTLHTWSMEMLALCLNGSSAQLQKNGTAGGLAGNPNSADDLTFLCPGSRGDGMMAGVLITN